LVDDYDGLGSISEAVINNPKNIDLVEMAPAQTPRAMEDVDASIINNGFARDAGLNPLDDSIFHEDETAYDYLNIIAVREEDKDNETLLKLAELFQEEDTAEFINDEYGGTLIPTFVPLEEIGWEKIYLGGLKMTTIQTNIKEKIINDIEENTDRYIETSHDIHGKPEIGNEEFYASGLLINLLEDEGFIVEKEVAGHKTAFVARKKSVKSGQTIAFLAEYDALPELGHACGHNIIGTMSVAAAIAFSKVS